MPTLAPRPRPHRLMDLPAVSFFGRTLEEYARFFALDPAELARQGRARRRGRAVVLHRRGEPARHRRGGG